MARVAMGRCSNAEDFTIHSNAKTEARPIECHDWARWTTRARIEIFTELQKE